MYSPPILFVNFTKISYILLMFRHFCCVNSDLQEFAAAFIFGDKPKLSVAFNMITDLISFVSRFGSGMFKSRLPLLFVSRYFLKERRYLFEIILFRFGNA